MQTFSLIHSYDNLDVEAQLEAWDTLRAGIAILRRTSGKPNSSACSKISRKEITMKKYELAIPFLVYASVVTALVAIAMIFGMLFLSLRDIMVMGGAYLIIIVLPALGDISTYLWDRDTLRWTSENIRKRFSQQ